MSDKCQQNESNLCYHQEKSGQKPFECQRCHREEVSVLRSEKHMCAFCEVCVKPYSNCKQCSKKDEFVNHTFLQLCSDCYSKIKW